MEKHMYHIDLGNVDQNDYNNLSCLKYVKNIKYINFFNIMAVVKALFQSFIQLQSSSQV